MRLKIIIEDGQKAIIIEQPIGGCETVKYFGEIVKHAIEQFKTLEQQMVDLERKKQIIRHSLGFKNGRNKSYRNRFCTNRDTVDFPICESMVKDGLMEQIDKAFHPDVFYIVTPKGQQLIGGVT